MKQEESEAKLQKELIAKMGKTRYSSHNYSESKRGLMTHGTQASPAYVNQSYHYFGGQKPATRTFGSSNRQTFHTRPLNEGETGMPSEIYSTREETTTFMLSGGLALAILNTLSIMGRRK